MNVVLKTVFPLVFLGIGLGCSQDDDADENEEEEEEEEEEEDDENDGAEEGDDGVEAFTSVLNDCASQYEDWAERIESADDAEDVVRILESAHQFEANYLATIYAAQMRWMLNIHAMESDERAEAHEDFVESIEEPGEDCARELEVFSRELGDNTVACIAYFDWYEEKNEGWEDYIEEARSHLNDCGNSGNSENHQCIDINLWAAFDDVPEPEDVVSVYECPDYYEYMAEQANAEGERGRDRAEGEARSADQPFGAGGDAVFGSPDRGQPGPDGRGQEHNRRYYEEEAAGESAPRGYYYYGE